MHVETDRETEKQGTSEWFILCRSGDINDAASWFSGMQKLVTDPTSTSGLSSDGDPIA